MFGPVTSQSGRAPGPSAPRSQSLATKLPPARRNAASTTGCRPPTTRKSRPVHHLRPHPVARPRRDRRARPPRRSPPAPWRWRRPRPARSSTASRRLAKTRRSISCACPPAFRILRLDLGERQRGEAQRAAGGLAVHEELAPRRVQHPLGMGRRGLDEVAEHVVVPDLQRADARSGARTPPAARRSPRAPRRAARRVASSSASNPAATKPPSRSSDRRLGDERRLEQRATSAACPPSAGAGLGQHLRQLAPPAPPRSRSAAASPSRIAARSRGPPRSSASRDSARSRSGTLRSCARAPPPRLRVAREDAPPRPGAPGSAAASVEGPFSRVSSSRAPRPGHRAVDRGEQRALAPAAEAARQLQVPPRRRVDRHQPARRLARRRPEQRQPALLGQLEVVDDGAERRSLRPAERRRSRRAPAPARPPRPAASAMRRIEARPRQRRRDRAGLGEQRRAAPPPAPR